MKNTKNVENVLLDFAKGIIDLYRLLVFDEKEFIFSKRLLKAGTGISFAYSCGKINKAWKKAVETKFWLEIVKSMWDFSNNCENKNIIFIKERINSVTSDLTSIFYILEKEE